MAEVDRLLARGPRASGWSADDHFAEEHLWASQVDDLNAEIDRYWREAFNAQLAWLVAAVGWITAIVTGLLWWRSLHGRRYRSDLIATRQLP